MCDAPAARLGETVYCKVCGLPITAENKGQAFGHNGQVWFAAHDGKCAETLRKGRDGLLQAANALLAVKAPRAHAFLTAVKTAMVKNNREQLP